MYQDMDVKDEAKKEGLVELIKKMYALMAQQEEKPEEEVEEGEGQKGEKDMSSMMDKKDDGGGLMAKAMESSEDKSMPDDLDMAEVKEFLSKKRKSPVSKSLNIMAITKAPMKNFSAPKMKKY